MLNHDFIMAFILPRENVTSWTRKWDLDRVQGLQFPIIVNTAEMLERLVVLGHTFWELVVLRNHHCYLQMGVCSHGGHGLDLINSSVLC